jgi:hypothetical protein
MPVMFRFGNGAMDRGLRRGVSVNLKQVNAVEGKMTEEQRRREMTEEQRRCEICEIVKLVDQVAALSYYQLAKVHLLEKDHDRSEAGRMFSSPVVPPPYSGQMCLNHENLT